VTYAPATLIAARTFLLDHLDFHPGVAVPADLDPDEVGIVGDTGHAATGSSYHLGRDQLRPDSYSIVESARDSTGLTDAASALDVGTFDVTVAGKRHTLPGLSIWLVAQCKAGTPDTKDIREVIYSPDGSTVKRWDRLGIRSTGDSSHTFHTHISYFRDSESHDKTALFSRYLTEIGLLEDDMTRDEMLALLRSPEGRDAVYAAVNRDTVQRYDGDAAAIPKDPAHPGDETMTWASALAFLGRDLQLVKKALAVQTAALAQLPAAVTGELQDAGDPDTAVIQAACERALAKLRLAVAEG
jgi:hypothetical protein